jgi:hypothetical protein
MWGAGTLARPLALALFPVLWAALYLGGVGGAPALLLLGAALALCLGWDPLPSRQTPASLALVALLACFASGPGRGLCFEELLTMPGGDAAPLNAGPIFVALGLFFIATVLAHAAALRVEGAVCL